MAYEHRQHEETPSNTSGESSSSLAPRKPRISVNPAASTENIVPTPIEEPYRLQSSGQLHIPGLELIDNTLDAVEEQKSSCISTPRPSPSPNSSKNAPTEELKLAEGSSPSSRALTQKYSDVSAKADSLAVPTPSQRTVQRKQSDMLLRPSADSDDVSCVRSPLSKEPSFAGGSPTSANSNRPVPTPAKILQQQQQRRLSRVGTIKIFFRGALSPSHKFEGAKRRRHAPVPATSPPKPDPLKLLWRAVRQMQINEVRIPNDKGRLKRSWGCTRT